MLDTRILIGLISILIAISTVVYIGINEPSRQDEFKQAFAGREVETGAAIFEEFCSPCHGIKAVGIPGVAPALNDAHFFNNRLQEIGYPGSIESYVRSTIAGGRPVQSAEGPYPRNMPAWSTDFGGPLRRDQVEAVAAYVLHWGEFYKEGGAAPLPATSVDCDTPEECGETLFQTLGCIGCHAVAGAGGAVGPDLTNIISEQGEDFVRQSIINPNAVITEGFQPNIMPQNFGERLSDDDLSSIIAYLALVGQ